MSEAAIRILLKAIIESVTDIGLVHDYRRMATTDKEFIDKFVTTIDNTRQVRGWQIYREGAAEDPHTTAAPHNYVIEGYMGIQDANATEKTFTALTEAIRTAVRSDTTLYNAGYAHHPVQIPTQNELSFGGVLCHHAKMTLLIYDFIT